MATKHKVMTTCFKTQTKINVPGLPTMTPAEFETYQAAQSGKVKNIDCPACGEVHQTGAEDYSLETK
jgi:hypothetical protein